MDSSSSPRPIERSLSGTDDLTPAVVVRAAQPGRIDDRTRSAAEVARIFHIAPADAWASALADGIYEDESLAGDGFIHFSFLGQVEGVANAWFRGQRNIVLIEVDPARLKAPLKIEQSAGDGPQFPHLYGPLNVDAVLRVMPLLEKARGFEIPPELGAD